MGKLALVTVTYNSDDNLPFFLPSTQENDEMIDGLFFVDNNSTDNTKKTLAEWKHNNKSFREIEVTHNKQNKGYAYGVNIGIKKALDTGYEYILVTNNDIIFEHGAVSAMMQEMSKTKSDVVGIPSSINSTEIGLGYTLDQNTKLPISSTPIKRERLEEEMSHNPSPVADFVHGGTILFSKNFFKKIGMYDDELFFGGDELDFLYRIDKHNSRHTDKIKCIVSLSAFKKIDNFSKHNTRNKITKAKRILQGTIRVYLKHRFTPLDTGLYREILKITTLLGKKSLLRYLVLFLFSIRALLLEVPRYYNK